jgi:hypothetical protein
MVVWKNSFSSTRNSFRSRIQLLFAAFAAIAVNSRVSDFGSAFIKLLNIYIN